MSAARTVGLLLGSIANEATEIFHARRGHLSHPGATEGGRHRFFGDFCRTGLGSVVLTGSALVLDTWARRDGRGRFWVRTLVTAVSVGNAVHSGRVARAGTLWGRKLETRSLDTVRQTLTSVDTRCTRDLDVVDLSRVSLETVAEQTSRTVVAPLIWTAMTGVPGLFVWQVATVLRAQGRWQIREMPRRSKWSPCSLGRNRNRIVIRLDEAVHMLPSRVAAMLVVIAAPVVGGSAPAAWQAWRRDITLHPYPSTGRAHAAFAGALNVRLGGVSTYPHGREELPVLGHGRNPDGGHVTRAAELSRVVGWLAGTASVLVTLLRTLGRRFRRRR